MNDGEDDDDLEVLVITRIAGRVIRLGRGGRRG